MKKKLIVAGLAVLGALDASAADDIASQVLEGLKERAGITVHHVMIEEGRGITPFIGPLEGEMLRGFVRISGEVESDAIKELAQHVALSTPGVSNVINALRVNPALRDEIQQSSEARARFVKPSLSDRELKENILTVLNKEGISTDHLIVLVKSGVVSIRGDQQNHRRIDEILSITLMVPGVEDIKSEMTICGKSY